MVGETSEQRQPFTGAPLPLLYANGFDLGVSYSDMSVVLLVDGIPQARLAMSFTSAKSLSIALAETVERFESATEHQVMTMQEVQGKLESSDRFKNASQ